MAWAYKRRPNLALARHLERLIIQGLGDRADQLKLWM